MTEKIRNKINSPVMDQIVRGVVLLVIPWSIWVTEGLYQSRAFQQRGDRFSTQDAHRLEKLLLEEERKTREMIYKFEMRMSNEFVRRSELKAIIDGLKR